MKPDQARALHERCPNCNGRFPVPAYMHHTQVECLANIADHRRVIGTCAVPVM